MSEPRLIFAEPYFEGLYRRGLKDELTPAMRAKLNEAGLNLDKLEPAYPADKAAEWMRLTSQLVFPAASADEALRLLGHRLFDGWSQTLLGGAATLVMKVLGPLGSLKRMSRNFRTGDNFTEVQFTELAPRDCELRFNDVLGMPTYYLGIMEAGSRAIGVKNPRIAVTRVEPPGAVLRVQWDA